MEPASMLRHAAGPGENRIPTGGSRSSIPTARPRAWFASPTAWSNQLECLRWGLSYFSTHAGLVAVDRKGKAVWLYHPKGWTSGWRVFPSMGGIALWDEALTVSWLDVPKGR